LKRDVCEPSEAAQAVGQQWDSIRRGGGHVSFANDNESDGAGQENTAISS
jgi:hypothetical protein